MKKSIYFSFFLAFLSLGCTESYIDGYDVSPNNPSVVLESNLLTATQVAVIGNVTGELSRTTSIWMQSQAGISNQSGEETAVYQLAEGDNTNEWTSIYTDWLETANDLVTQAGTTDPYYKGMGYVMQAWGGAFTSDIWGDVPFSEALKGLDNLYPSFDTQEAVYSEAQAQLSLAIKLFAKAEADNKTLPASDDIFYGGDVAKWTKLAWALKARYHNRASLHHSYSADSVLICAANSFTSTDDNLLAQFGTNANNANQWAAFYQQRKGYMAMGEFLVEKMKTDADPRLPFYAYKDKNGAYTGSPVDTRNVNLDASPIGSYFVGGYNADGIPTSIDLPVPMVTFEEIKFLQAEALLATDKASAATAYNEGVKASVKYVTKADAPAEFVTSNASETSATINIGKIISGKYDALFTSVEVWNDWRRLGLPTLVANPNPIAESKGIPLRFPTVIDERLYNTSAIVVSDNYKKVWFAGE
jgi:hypothetical protein